MVYCDDWVQVKFGHSFVTIDRLNDGTTGGKGSKGVAFKDMKHFEFSDNCLIQPVWLNKVLNFSGPNPQKRAEEVSEVTVGFLEKNRK